MGRDSIDVENLQVTGAQPSSGREPAPLSYPGDVIVVVNQAFGPTGESLMTRDVQFDDYPAIALLVRALGREAFVYLSPIHGDGRKVGFDDLPEGTKCELLCPRSRQPLDKVGPIGEHGASGQAEYCALYLTPRLEQGSMVYVSDVWGHHHSRIVLNSELISHWVAAENLA